MLTRITGFKKCGGAVSQLQLSLVPLPSLKLLLVVRQQSFSHTFLFIFLINHDELQVTLSNMYLVSFVIPADERIFFFINLLTNKLSNAQYNK